MKKAFVLAVAIILTPSLAHAAWWNPWTWIDLPSNEQVIIPRSETDKDSFITAVPSSTISDVPGNDVKLVPIPVEKTVEKVVPDQSIVVENNLLKFQIEQLKYQISSLQNSIKQCQAYQNNTTSGVGGAVSEGGSIISPCEQARDDLYALDQQVVSLKKEENEQISNNNFLVSTRNKVEKSNEQIIKEYQAKIDAINNSSDILEAQAKIKRYCQ